VVLVLESAETAAARGARVLATADAFLDAAMTGIPRSAMPGRRPGSSRGSCPPCRPRAGGHAVIRPRPRPPRVPSPRRRHHRRRPAHAHRAAFRRVRPGTAGRHLGRGPDFRLPRAGFPVALACEVPTAALALPEALATQMHGLDDRKGMLALAAALAAVADAPGALSPGAALIYGTGLSSVSLRELEEDCLPFLDAPVAFDYPRFGLDQASGQPAGATRRHAVERPMDLLRSTWDSTGRAFAPLQRLRRRGSRHRPCRRTSCVGVRSRSPWSAPPTRWFIRSGFCPSSCSGRPHRTPIRSSRRGHSTNIATAS
jgi:hypothetical protein